MAVNTYSLRSTAIASVDYDDETEELTIEFVNGGSATYDGVPRNEVERLVNASSPGRHYHTYIKGMY